MSRAASPKLSFPAQKRTKKRITLFSQGQDSLRKERVSFSSKSSTHTRKVDSLYTQKKKLIAQENVHHYQDKLHLHQFQQQRSKTAALDKKILDQLVEAKSEAMKRKDLQNNDNHDYVNSHKWGHENERYNPKSPMSSRNPSTSSYASARSKLYNDHKYSFDDESNRVSSQEQGDFIGYRKPSSASNDSQTYINRHAHQNNASLSNDISSYKSSSNKGKIISRRNSEDYIAYDAIPLSKPLSSLSLSSTSSSFDNINYSNSRNIRSPSFVKSENLQGILKSSPSISRIQSPPLPSDSSPYANSSSNHHRKVAGPRLSPKPYNKGTPNTNIPSSFSSSSANNGPVSKPLSSVFQSLLDELEEKTNKIN